MNRCPSRGSAQVYVPPPKKNNNLLYVLGIGLVLLFVFFRNL
jgi:hypothetical protein